jgi:hypothetical protein
VDGRGRAGRPGADPLPGVLARGAEGPPCGPDHPRSAPHQREGSTGYQFDDLVIDAFFVDHHYIVVDHHHGRHHDDGQWQGGIAWHHHDHGHDGSGDERGRHDHHRGPDHNNGAVDHHHHRHIDDQHLRLPRPRFCRRRPTVLIRRRSSRVHLLGTRAIRDRRGRYRWISACTPGVPRQPLGTGSERTHLSRMSITASQSPA